MLDDVNLNQFVEKKIHDKEKEEAANTLRIRRSEFLCTNSKAMMMKTATQILINDRNCICAAKS